MCESAFKFALQTPKLSEFSMASSTLFITSRISAFNSEVELSIDCLDEKSWRSSPTVDELQNWKSVLVSFDYFEFKSDFSKFKKFMRTVSIK